jgi:ATP-dependent RNA helicase DDX55/SPB4
MKDRDILDKAQNAFVSFVRYYKEHNLEFIFSYNSLDIGSVANSFFLFKIPRVREILGKQVAGFKGDQSIDVEALPYKDSNKEKQKIDLKEKRKVKLV